MWDKYLRRLLLVSIYNYLYSQFNELNVQTSVDYTTNSQWLQLMLTATDCQQGEYEQIEAKFSLVWDDFLSSKGGFEEVIEPKLNDKQKTYTLLRAIFYTYLLEKKDLALSEASEIKALINIYLKLLQQFGANENRQFAHAILANLDTQIETSKASNDLDKD